jgi:poly-gamma-glutamate synthesis protein (capsule biosynthesis protein)
MADLTADTMSHTESGPRLTIAALGDLMLAGEWDARAAEGAAEAAWRGLRELCGEPSLVFGNLEATLPGSDGFIDKEPRLVGEPHTFRQALSSLALDIACVGNNHAFDARLSGFEAVSALLETSGVPFIGAGREREEAARPLTVERNGIVCGWLAFTDAATRPSHVATEASSGVALLEADRAVEEVRELAGQVDQVVVSLHWGVEYSHLPSPEQIRVARSLVDAGARLVIGHHAHVVQGVERYRRGVIAYNLGNAIATDLYVGGRLAIRQTRRTRSSFILKATLDRSQVESLELVPFRFEGARLLARDRYAESILSRANARLARGISPARWRAQRAWDDVVLRGARKLHPRVIRSLRPRHLGKLIANLYSAVRGRGPS